MQISRVFPTPVRREIPAVPTKQVSAQAKIAPSKCLHRRRLRENEKCAKISPRRKATRWSSGAAGAQVPYKHKVGGSNPSSTTIEMQDAAQEHGVFFFNMSRTLSIGKVGPGPGFLGQALSPSQPSCGDLGVSLRRSSLQFNIRPWRISELGNPLLRLGLPRSIRQSMDAGGAFGARKKRDWG